MSSCAQELCLNWGGDGEVCICVLFNKPRRCSNCYESFSGPWCDGCDQWPCVCFDESGDE